MGLGIVERVKKTFDRKRNAEAEGGSKSGRDAVLAELTFEQASALVAPGGAMDRARRPADAAAKKAPDVKQAVATASALAHWKTADGASAKKAPAQLALGAHKQAPMPNAALAKASQAQVSPYLASPVPSYQKSPLRAPPADILAQSPPSPYTKSPSPPQATDALVQLPPARADAHAPPDEGLYFNLGQDADVDAETSEQAPPRQQIDEPLYQTEPTRHDDRAPASPMEAHASLARASHELSDEEQERIATLAVERVPEGMSPQALATLREASQHDARDEARVDMTDEELQKKGWALLPMMGSQRQMDTQQFKTNYRYADEADLQANKAGATQSTDRDEAIVELDHGRFVFAKTGQALESKELHAPGFLVKNLFKSKREELGRDLSSEEKEALNQEILEAGGRYIFVMDSSGTIYAGESLFGVQHHSSFMGGGSVAAAGEIAVSGGKLTLISNQSGHYQPGPGFLWQAIAQMASQGVDMSGVTAEILGVGAMNAAIFLQSFNPVDDPRLMQADYAIAALKSYLGPDPRTADGHGAQTPRRAYARASPAPRDAASARMLATRATSAGLGSAAASTCASPCMGSPGGTLVAMSKSASTPACERFAARAMSLSQAAA